MNTHYGVEITTLMGDFTLVGDFTHGDSHPLLWMESLFGGDFHRL